MSRRKRPSPPSPPDEHSSTEPASPARPRRALVAIVVTAILIAIAADIWWIMRPDKPSQTTGNSTSATNEAGFVGSDACMTCHADAYAAWKDSQHALAMQHATADTVLGDFDQAKFSYAGTESTFFQRDGKYFVRTDGADGQLADFKVDYTYGVEPLQQYLISFPDGRLQALSIAWDERSKEQGGQRWFHLYPGESVDYQDELHWTRRSQNWNFMCADCHSTDVRKGYDADSDTFDTTWADMTVGCEACHGPASRHIEWTEAGSKDPHNGLTVALDERASARWIIDTTTAKPVRSQVREQDTEIEVCAQCHARRSQIAEGYRAGLPFMDFYRPALLNPGLYHADGQQLDEVYIWGSFLQSRMYHAGVTCSDCHEPHGQKLRAEGNAVCASCHMATKYDDESHHHHAPDSAGAQCVACHMPETTYMVVDPRRDHSLRIPRPDLTTTLGTPNACNSCHRDADAKWAAQSIEKWVVHQPQGFQQYSSAFQFAETGAAEAERALAQIADNPSHPAIARASALERLTDYLTPESIDTARKGLTDDNALVRRASIVALSSLPVAQRSSLLVPLLDDPVRTVRMEATNALADAMGGASAAQRAAFNRGALEYEAAQKYNADRPEALASLGSFNARRGRSDQALSQMKSALALDPAFVPAYINMADMLRAQARDDEAERTLRAGLRYVPDAPALHHSLGLTLVRLNRNAEALAELQRAAQLAPSDPRLAYVYAVALNSLGKSGASLVEIDRALKHRPDNRDLLVAAAMFRRDGGDIAGARNYANRLARRYPTDPAAARLVRELGGGK